MAIYKVKVNTKTTTAVIKFLCNVNTEILLILYATQGQLLLLARKNKKKKKLWPQDDEILIEQTAFVGVCGYRRKKQKKTKNTKKGNKFLVTLI